MASNHRWSPLRRPSDFTLTDSVMFWRVGNFASRWLQYQTKWLVKTNRNRGSYERIWWVVPGFNSTVLISWLDDWTLWHGETWRLSERKGIGGLIPTKMKLSWGSPSEYCARIYRHNFRENKPKTLVFSERKPEFWACFCENWVYKFGRWIN